ncbi:hypothetical protein SSS_06614 [Sarcoptes scabiei]|uniref:Uncharacterized protein n=1 Tax=Sarcoptes scabiei TaxID=52283 RepID=A0A834VG34_SARSC|nr:hypothetical protein SSS_06614 [Sarcoptes scabiei]
MALFDSGSNKTIAPSSLIKPENRFRKRCGTASTTGYLSIIGSTNVDVNLQNIQFKHHILIADDISHVIFANISKKGVSPKLSNVFKGPFIIDQILPNNKIVYRDKTGRLSDTHRDLIKFDHTPREIQNLRTRGRPRAQE